MEPPSRGKHVSSDRSDQRSSPHCGRTAARPPERVPLPASGPRLCATPPDQRGTAAGGRTRTAAQCAIAGAPWRGRVTVIDLGDAVVFFSLPGGARSSLRKLSAPKTIADSLKKLTTLIWPRPNLNHSSGL